MSRPLFKRNGSWDPLQDWPKSSILDQCSGAPFFLKENDGSWLDTARKTLEKSPWPGFLSFPLVSPVCPEISSPSSSSKDGPQMQLPPAESNSKSWRISLDVFHFCPEEIGVRMTEGYLEVTGKHEERQNKRGTISRSFTRKYKLPAEIDLQQMSSSLSPEGVLLVEAPLGASSTSLPADTVIPIQIKQKH
ncbi:heat shock protein, alpha-crystallin-related, b15 [Trichomycterus rosablanca]|uniref:heat shock protein, alpha-crystallin-related, b15 n=1 Tax=Trichomycterus rosablanca TaxID=2290929 RepID=UPI002F355B78